ncbi:MAG: DoxX family protein [bacterium]
MSTMHATAPRTASTSRVRAPKPATGRLWFAQAVLAFAYVGAGAPKLGADPHLVAKFADLGISAAGMHTIGVLEIAGAAGLLIPRLVGAAAAALVALMVGAVTLTVVHVGGVDAIGPAGFLGVAAVVAWGRRDRTVRLAADLARAGRRPPTLIGQARHG